MTFDTRGTCSTCGRIVSRRMDGSLRKHNSPDGAACPGEATTNPVLDELRAIRELLTMQNGSVNKGRRDSRRCPIHSRAEDCEFFACPNRTAKPAPTGSLLADVLTERLDEMAAWNETVAGRLSQTVAQIRAQAIRDAADNHPGENALLTTTNEWLQDIASQMEAGTF